MTLLPLPFHPVYGPVDSWRFGRSLGIDLIGPVTTCSFNCVYCQLGEVQERCTLRQVFVSTEQVMAYLRSYQPWDPFDVVTISGSGEPTLAQNLGEVIRALRAQTHHPVVVLSNGTLLRDQGVRLELALADQVAVKLDGITPAQVARVNRPLEDFNLEEILLGLELFRQEYAGHLALQTMILSPWLEQEESAYIQLLQRVQPNEVQLNIPSRPRVLSRQIWARGNHPPLGTQTHGLRKLNCVHQGVLTDFADRIRSATGIHVRCAPLGPES